MDIFNLNAETWQSLQQRRGQLPHALLLSGHGGTGLFELAEAFAKALLCESETGQQDHACGQCIACGWLAQKNHPDFRLVRPEAMEEGDESASGEGKKKPSQQILIDQVRDLEDFLTVGTHRQGLRIIIVYPAEAMNRNTANALLKMLEEPPAETLFMLVSLDAAKLLPTIRSRCQIINAALPPKALAKAYLSAAGVPQAERWLALAGGAPVLAKTLAEQGEPPWLNALLESLSQGKTINPLQAAAQVDQKIKASKDALLLPQVVAWTQKWALDLALSCQSMPVRYFSQHGATMQKLAPGLGLTKITRYGRLLVKTRMEAEQPLNSRLFLEDLFLNYQKLFRN